MSKVHFTEQEEYDALWQTDEAGHQPYSNENVGYTPHFEKFMDQGLAKLQSLGHPIKALEVGCGNGLFTSKMADKGCDAEGLDLSPVAIESARRRWPKAKFRVHNLVEPLPFDDQTFDFVWCSEVLEHLFAPLAVLSEIHRVLRPGGRLHATVPHHSLIKNLGIALFAFERHYDPTYPHVRFFTKKSLGDLARRAGLTVESMGTCGSNLGLRDLIVKTNILMAARRDK